MAVIGRRTDGTGCPACARNRARKSTLAAGDPAVARDWHPTKNGDLTAADIGVGSSKHVWWQCERGHEWRTVVRQRTRDYRTGCPFCSGRRVSADNCLAAVDPELSRQLGASLPDLLEPKAHQVGRDLARL